MTERVLGAAYYPDDAHLEPVRLAKQVARVAELTGAEIREQESVKKLECRAGRIVAVETTRERYEPGIVIVAAGAWTADLANTLGLNLPTRPVKGQIVMADCSVPPVRTPLHAGDALLVPWPDGRVAIGVTLKKAGFDDRVRLDSLRQILDRVIDLAPAVGQLGLDFAWAGRRPATRDERPYMGRAVGFDNFPEELFRTASPGTLAYRSKFIGIDFACDRLILPAQLFNCRTTPGGPAAAPPPPA